MQTSFTLRYATQLGENIYLHLKQDHEMHLIPMRFIDAQSWSIECEIAFSSPIHYHFSIRDTAGQILREEKHERTYAWPQSELRPTLHLIEQWDVPNFAEHFLINKILANSRSDCMESNELRPEHDHLFEINAPLYNPHHRVCLLGEHELLGAWDTQGFIELRQVAPGKWQAALDLSAMDGSVSYKYGIFDAHSRRFLSFEAGENRHFTIQRDTKSALSVVHDLGYRFLPEQMWRAAGVAIPIFSLRSGNALGSGEFSDLKLLGDWAHQVGLSLIQVLPINDSSINYSWEDHFPYSAISVYALHPQYLSIRELPFALSSAQSAEFEAEQAHLNACASIDFERMIQTKWRLLRAIFHDHQTEILQDPGLSQFIAEQAFWLKPYALFCTLRDQYGTIDFSQWKSDATFSSARCEAYFNPDHPQYATVMLHCFVQYHLHLQLGSAIAYLHQLGVSIKGDLPIGVRRHSVDTWVEPQWFGMDFQAGAPPDMFSDLGQNWELPTYDWPRMREDGYGWWKNRLSALAQYFDAMRIDHVLGFFRIWRIPSDATQGLLGYFYPALGITTLELAERGIDFDEQRDCTPWVSEAMLTPIVGADTANVLATYFQPDPLRMGHYVFKPEFDTQRKVVAYCKSHPDAAELQTILLNIHTNVLFIRESTPNGVVYHPRFNVQQTWGFQALEKAQQEQLYALYIDYFFVRQEALWRASGLEKLPALQNATDMLICAEDLGLVPDCVPQVLEELGIVALKIQRSPKEHIPYYDPKNIGYMNVTTTSSHDSSTLRQWWMENPELTQHYYNEQLQRSGIAPSELTPALAEQIIRQNLQSPAMLALFPLQDWLATSEKLRHPNANAERINNPADPNQRWNYRMHITLEQLCQEHEFNHNITQWITLSDRLSPK